MGRELKRVPLDFDWPLNKVWSGFRNPHFRHCLEEGRTCFNGETAGGAWFSEICRLFAMVADQALDNTPERIEDARMRGRIYPHPYLRDFPTAPTYGLPRDVRDRISDIETQPEANRAWARAHRDHPKASEVVPPTADFARFFEAFVGKPAKERFFSRFESYDFSKKLLEVAGMEASDVFACPVCKGENQDPAYREAYEAWRETPVPEGEGWQLWETVSEGSPISPVFPTREAFVDHLVGEGYGRKAAESFCDVGSVCSMVISGDGRIYKDIESAELVEKS